MPVVGGAVGGRGDVGAEHGDRAFSVMMGDRDPPFTVHYCMDTGKISVSLLYCAVQCSSVGEAAW